MKNQAKKKTKKRQVFDLLSDGEAHDNSELLAISMHAKDYIAQFRKGGACIETMHQGGGTKYTYQMILEEEKGISLK